MSSLKSDALVGQLVAERPSRSRVFDRLGIDYCCAGRIPLAQACAEKKLDVNAVLRELADEDLRNADADRSDGTIDLTMTELADQIVATHHAYLHRELPRLAGLVAKVADVHGAGHPELREVQQVFRGLKDELDTHMMKEEKVLFPIIRQLEAATTMPAMHCGSVNNPIHMMEHEHESTGSALQRLRALTNAYKPPGDACNTYLAMLQGLAELEADTHRHIHKENSILFPRASAKESALQGA